GSGEPEASGRVRFQERTSCSPRPRFPVADAQSPSTSVMEMGQFLEKRTSQKRSGPSLFSDLAPRGAAQYPARPPEISNTAPVLKEQASEQSQATSSATSSAEPSRCIGLLPTI